MTDDERERLVTNIRMAAALIALDGNLVMAENLTASAAQLRTDGERIKALEAALMPFAMAGELFNGPAPAEFDQRIYSPAAGDEWSICGDDLRRARDALTSEDRS